MKLTNLHEEQEHTCKPELSMKPAGMGYAEFFKRAKEECKACQGIDEPESPVEEVPELQPDRPKNKEELQSFVKDWSEPWEAFDNPGDLKQGDPCPECGSVLRPKRKFLGTSKFLGCSNNHAFTILPKKRKERKEREPGKPVPASPGPGRFGTGRPAKISADDSPLMKLLKTLRDEGGEKWSRRGQFHGRRIREKASCSFGHSCPETSPTGKHRDYPVIKDRELFDDVTGAPKPEYRDYYIDKMRCPVCSGKEPRCPNKVSAEFGRAKPYCSEHIGASPYIQDLEKRVADQPDPNQDYRETEAVWKRVRGQLLRVGDRVKLGKNTGRLIGIDDKMSDGRTHVVKWDNPKTAALEVTYNDPEKLDLDY